MRILNTTGIEVPDNFPADDYTKIHDIITTHKVNYESLWKEHGIAWNALSYRYKSLSEYNDKYLELIKLGNAPQPKIRSEQEEIIFNFFVTGFSILDIIAYSIYMTASIVDDVNFPVNDQIKPNIDIGMVKNKLGSYFTSEKITTYLDQLVTSTEYQEWKSIRNILIHRGQPGRDHYLGGAKDGIAEWIYGLNIDEHTIMRKFSWLDNQVSELMTRHLAFVLLVDNKF